MASPQRKFSTVTDPSPAPQPQIHKDPPAPPTSPTSRGWRFGYSWILLLLILGFWYVGFGWGDSGGWIWGHRNAPIPVSSDSGVNGTGIAILEVANKQDYVGQSFQISDVSVDHGSGNGAVWIGSRHSYLPMLLILPPGSPLASALTDAAAPDMGALGDSASGAARVQHLDVTGRIMKAPPTAQAQQQWKLSDEDVDQLEEEGVYIQASKVQLAAH
ncbi:MAG TPA: hypothetical protein VHX13_03120 [Acidobacteriaceae bacterium]|jgi:hypothetical protein|nr:hypothetical protein [Acidobacteriaceae bacterium]